MDIPILVLALVFLVTNLVLLCLEFSSSCLRRTDRSYSLRAASLFLTACVRVGFEHGVHTGIELTSHNRHQPYVSVVYTFVAPSLVAKLRSLL